MAAMPVTGTLLTSVGPVPFSPPLHHQSPSLRPAYLPSPPLFAGASLAASPIAARAAVRRSRGPARVQPPQNGWMLWTDASQSPARAGMLHGPGDGRSCRNGRRRYSPRRYRLRDTHAWFVRLLPPVRLLGPLKQIYPEALGDSYCPKVRCLPPVVPFISPQCTKSSPQQQPATNKSEAAMVLIVLRWKMGLLPARGSSPVASVFLAHYCTTATILPRRLLRWQSSPKTRVLLLTWSVLIDVVARSARPCPMPRR